MCFTYVFNVKRLRAIQIKYGAISYVIIIIIIWINKYTTSCDFPHWLIQPPTH